MTDPYIGEVRLFAGNFAPQNWALCNGQVMQIRANTALFSILGTTYGGNGTTTFALPNLQGSVPVAPGQSTGGSFWDLGQQQGAATVTLDPTQMPAHNHELVTTSSLAADTGGSGEQLATGFKGTLRSSVIARMYTDEPPATQMSGESVGVAGGGGAHNNMMPYLAVSFCIALQGEYPPRP